MLADIVINHRVGVNDWADFEDPYWPTEESICADDEWEGGPKSPNPDTGEKYEAGRDLDHTHPTVQNGIKRIGWPGLKVRSVLPDGDMIL